mmetsp:Transcript_19238/g.40400  ORF Transcript_19238/g.40400 Transcript_19238/m.40400 type:complete len:421 (-) Transcript_19238:55-1317(-)
MLSEPSSNASQKRKRSTTGDEDQSNTHNRRSSKRSHQEESASRKSAVDDTKSSSSTPAWISSADIFPWGSSAATYGNCPNVSSRYEKIGRIGEGTYGVVYKARDKNTGDIVALKRCLPHHEASDGFPFTTLREITLLRELQSEGSQHGIVSLKDVAVSSSRSGVFLVFEYSQHDLATLVDTHYTQYHCSPFRESEVKRLFLQLLDAVKFLHSRHVLHRDLKMSNLLYNHRGELRVADFGLARRVGAEYIGDGFRGNDSTRRNCLTPKVVSLWYRPPELLLGSEYYDRGVDNWGAGCILGELLRGKPLMDGKEEMEQIQKMFDFLGPPNIHDWPGLKEMPLLKEGSIDIPKRWHIQSGKHILDIFRKWSSSNGLKLMTGLLQYDPSKRWSADEALASKYFSELPAPTPLSLMPTFPTKHSK